MKYSPQKITRTERKRVTGLIFVFFLLINLVSTGGHFDSNDGIVYFLITENIVLNNSIKIDPNSPSLEKLRFNIYGTMKVWAPDDYDAYLQGNERPFHLPGGVFGSIIAVPWYFLSILLQAEATEFVAFFNNSVLMTFTSLIIFLLGKEFFYSQRISFVLALIFSLSSFIWPYNTSFFLQPTLALLLITSLYFIVLSKKNKTKIFPIMGGVFLGLSILTHPSSLIVLPGLFIYGIIQFRVEKKSIILFISPIFILGIIQGLLNYVKYQSVIDFGYAGYQSISLHDNWEGLVGLIFSPGWGILAFFPMIILLPIALNRTKSENKSLFFLIVYIFTSIWLFYGTGPSPFWSGFGGWGPRYFIPFLPFATIALGYLFLNLRENPILKISITILAVGGFVVNLLGSLVWYMYGYSYAWGRDALWRAEDSFKIMAWDPIYSPIALHFKVLNSDFIQAMNIPKDAINYHNLGMFPCAYDSYVFCNFGIVITILVIFVIVFVGILILKEIIFEANRQNITKN